MAAAIFVLTPRNQNNTETKYMTTISSYLEHYNFQIIKGDSYIFCLNENINNAAVQMCKDIIVKTSGYQQNIKNFYMSILHKV
jgi:hypothetical protein